jgi:G3E family GTPase
MVHTPTCPIWVISGFLGSGKTSLLLQLLESAKQREMRLAIIMNELGAIDVDRTTVAHNPAGHDVPVHSLLNGCLCCDHIDQLRTVVSLAYTTNQPDGMIIELSGVAHPTEIVAALAHSTDVPVHLQGIVTVVDAGMVLEYISWFNPDLALKTTCYEQIDVADALVINKVNTASKRTLRRIAQLLNSRNSEAKTYWTNFASIDPQWFWDVLPTYAPPSPTPPIRHARIRAKRLPHTLQFSSHKQFQRAIRSWPPSLFRAKGTVIIAKTPYAFQWASRNVSLQPNPPALEGMVLIGYPEALATVSMQVSS